MVKHHCTVRSLAASLELSPSTVAAALHGSVRFKPETVNRVRAAAEAAGYRRNLLLSSMMSEIRRCRVRGFKGVLAMVDIGEHDRPPNSTLFHQRMMNGARERAAELGFKLEVFSVDEVGMTVSRLNSILCARDIRGILLLPAWQMPDLSGLDWSRLAGVYTDYLMDRPALNSVCPDHFRGMMEALGRLGERGYRRPGLFLNQKFEQRVQFHWSGAFLGFQRVNLEMGNVPLLFTDALDRHGFMRWFKRFRPDVVIGHRSEVIDWMVECGARVPETHGFVILNQIWRDRPCAGLDLQPVLIAARAVELLSAQVQRGETGVPAHPLIAGIPPQWIDGPTLQSAAQPAAEERVVRAV